jgi:hypothetical protein
MISASATLDVPWGYVCGYPTHRGDLYGGAHYRQSSSATLTPQGRAIAAASRRFGNGETLPFTPCKRGYIPVVVVVAASGDASEQPRAMFACHLHDRFRRRRYLKEKSTFRPGEVDLSRFWEQDNFVAAGNASNQKQKKSGTSDEPASFIVAGPSVVDVDILQLHGIDRKGEPE